ncbi:MAG: ATP-binding protein, partial [Antricoccus sp.]
MPTIAEPDTAIDALLSAISLSGWQPGHDIIRIDGETSPMQMNPPCQLVAFCGLPGVGKTALSRRVADRLGATFLRIDTIESAIASTLAPIGDSPVGYVVAGRVAADQLRAGRAVVADGVNNVLAARQQWIDLARDLAVPLRFIEV